MAFREDQLVDYCKQYIVVNHRVKGKPDACINTIPFHNPDLRPLCYALLFPKGHRLFYPGIPLTHSVDIERKKHSDDLLNDDDADDDEHVAIDDDMEQLAHVVVRHKTASHKDVILFHIYQRRTDLHHFAWNTGLLGQQYLDEFLACESDRQNYVRTNNVKKRVALQRDVEEYVAQHYAKKGVKIGRHITLPGNFTGSAHYKAHLFHNCSALYTITQRPTWFITFTGNPCWREITENLLVGQSAYSNAPLICRVFKHKADLIIDCIKKGALGKLVSYAYTIEFQKRGMPHMHLLVATIITITTPQELDKWLSAELPEAPLSTDPDFAVKQRYYEVVTKHLIHGPCEYQSGLAPWPCRADMSLLQEDGKCAKYFPSDYLEQSTLTGSGYAQPHRRDNQRQQQFGKGITKCTATNQHVVCHNPFRATLLEAHVNVEHVNCPQSSIVYAVDSAYNELVNASQFSSIYAEFVISEPGKKYNLFFIFFLLFVLPVTLDDNRSAFEQSPSKKRS